MTVAERFGRNLRRHRKLMRMSQEELGARADSHRTHIGLLENGKRMPRIDTVIKIAAALEVEFADLVQGIEWIPDDRTPRRGQFWDGGR